VELDASGHQQLPGASIVNALTQQIFGTNADPNTLSYCTGQIDQMRQKGMSDSQIVQSLYTSMTSGSGGLSSQFKTDRQGVTNNNLATDINNATLAVLGTNVDAGTMNFLMGQAQQMQTKGASDAQIQAWVESAVGPNGGLSQQFKTTQQQLSQSSGTQAQAASATTLVDQVLGIDPTKNPGPLATQGAPPAPTDPYSQMLNALLGTGGAPAGVQTFMSTGTDPLASLNSLFPTMGSGGGTFTGGGTDPLAGINTAGLFPGASDYSSLISQAQSSMQSMQDQMNQQMQTMSSMFNGSNGASSFSSFGTTPQFSVPSSLAAYAPPFMM